jgi:hypothetical protein
MAGIGSYGYEHVVTTVWCMDNPDTVNDALPYAATSGTFEDHHSGLDESICSGCGTNPFHKCPGCSWSIAPPSRGTRTDHVRRIDQEHCPSLAHQTLEDLSTIGELLVMDCGSG